MEANNRVNIEISTDQAMRNLLSLESAYRANEKALEDLARAGKTNTDEYRKMVISQRGLEAEMKKEQEQIGLTSKSYYQLQKQHNALMREFNKAIPGSEYRKKLEEEILSVRKAMDNAKVGASQTEGTFKQLTSGLSSAIPGFSGVSDGIGKVTQASRTFIATPIGAVVTALVATVGALREAFTRSAEGQEKWNRIMGAAQGVITVVLDLAADLGEGLISVFEKPGEAWQSFKHYTLDPLINYFQAIINGAQGCAYAIAGIFSEEAREKRDEYFARAGDNIKEMGKTVVEMWNGVKKGASAVVEKITETTKKVQENAKEGAAVAELENRLSRQRVENATRLAELENESNQARLEFSKKDQYNAQEREAFLQKAIDAENKAMNIRLEQARLEAEIQTRKNAMGKSTREDLQREADLKAEVIRIEASNAAKQKEMVAQLSELRLSAARAEAAEKEKQRKAEAAEQARLRQEEADRLRRESDDALAAFAAARDQELDLIREQQARREITEEEARNRSLVAEMTYLERVRQERERMGEDTAEIDRQIRDKELQALEEYYEKMEAMAAEAQEIISELSRESAGMRAKEEIEIVTAHIKQIGELIEEGAMGSIEGIIAYSQTVFAQVQSILGQVTAAREQAIDQDFQIEMGKLTEQYNQRLSAAEGNEEEQQAIREEYAAQKEQLEYEAAQKKLELEKKSADANLAIGIGQAVAGAAQAIVQCYAQMGPIAGAIMAGIISGITAAQIAMMVKQRNAIKAQTLEAPDSAASSATAQTPTVTRQIIEPESVEYVEGYAEGGYTEVRRSSDGRRFRASYSDPRRRGYITGPALLVGEEGGEFVANAQAISNPHLRPVFDLVDRAQRAGRVSRIDRRALSRAIDARGFAEGGYTAAVAASASAESRTPVASSSAGESLSSDLALAVALLRSIDARLSAPSRSYVVYDDIETAASKMNRTRNNASFING